MASYSPTDTSSCLLWLDASSGVEVDSNNYVTGWNNKINNTFTKALPYKKGLISTNTNISYVNNAVRFTNTSNSNTIGLYFDMTAGLLNNFNIYIVFGRPTTAKATYETLVARNSSITNTNVPSIFDMYNDSRYFGNGSQYESFSQNNISTVSTPTILNMSYVQNSTNAMYTECSIYKNAPNVKPTTRTVTKFSDNGNKFFIGTRGDLVTQCNSEIREIIVCTNNNNSEQIMNYLLNKHKEYIFPSGLGIPNGLRLPQPPIACIEISHRLLTPSGYKSIHELKVDDYLMTDKKTLSKIKHIEIFTVDANSETAPYKVPKNFFRKNIPKRDILLTKNHLIYYKKQYIHPMFSQMFTQVTDSQKYSFYHIQLENYETDNLVLEGGLVVESLGIEKDLDTYKKRILSNPSNKIRKNTV